MTTLHVIDGRRNRATRLFFQCLLSKQEIFGSGVLAFTSTCSGTCYWLLLHDQEAGLTRASRKAAVGRDGRSVARTAEPSVTEGQETIAVHLDGIMGDGGPPSLAIAPVAEPVGGEGHAPAPASASDNVPPFLNRDAIAGDEAACAYVLPCVIPGLVVSREEHQTTKDSGHRVRLQEVPCAQNRCSTQE